MYQIIEKGSVSFESDWIEIPYEYTSSGHIKIYLEVDGTKYPFIVDSGASNILFGDSQGLSNEFKGFSFSVDSNDKPSFVKIRSVESITIGTLTGNDLRFKIIEYSADCEGEAIGIIGKEAMRHHVWQFLPERNMIRIAKSQDHITHFPNEDTIKLRRNKYSHHLYARISIDGRKSNSYFVDTGSNGKITTPLDSTWKVQEASKVFGRTSKGLGGIDKTASYIFRIDSLNFKNGGGTKGPMDISVSDRKFKALGSAFLRNFNFTLDWKNKQMILAPLEKQRFIYRDFGARLNVDEDGVFVTTIIENSSAYQAQLEVGQRIDKVNGVLASELDGCTLVEKVNESDTLKLTFKKEDEINSVNLLRENLFN
ncbi:retropepsin-like aspartic protease [Ekhidna sp.]